MPMIAYVHLQPTTFFPRGRWTNCRIPLCSRVCF